MSASSGSGNGLSSANFTASRTSWAISPSIFAQSSSIITSRLIRSAANNLIGSLSSQERGARSLRPSDCAPYWGHVGIGSTGGRKRGFFSNREGEIRHDFSSSKSQMFVKKHYPVQKNLLYTMLNSKIAQKNCFLQKSKFSICDPPTLGVQISSLAA